MSYDDLEAYESERHEADMEQAELEAAGREHSRGMRRYAKLRAAGDLDGAAAACSHGGGYPLTSLAAQYAKDPNAGEDGFRCRDCGSRFDKDPFFNDDAEIVAACEIKGDEDAR